MKVIESKAKDTDSFGDLLSTDAIRVAVLVCALSLHILDHILILDLLCLNLYIIFCRNKELGRFSWV